MRVTVMLVLGPLSDLLKLVVLNATVGGTAGVGVGDGLGVGVGVGVDGAAHPMSVSKENVRSFGGVTL